MSICLHKLVNRVSAINPILLQNRTLVTPSLIASIQNDSAVRIDQAIHSFLLLFSIETEADWMKNISRKIA